MPEDHVALTRLTLEEREPVTAGLRRVEQLAVVVEIERTAHDDALLQTLCF